MINKKHGFPLHEQNFTIHCTIPIVCLVGISNSASLSPHTTVIATEFAGSMFTIASGSSFPCFATNSAYLQKMRERFNNLFIFESVWLCYRICSTMHASVNISEAFEFLYVTTVSHLTIVWCEIWHRTSFTTHTSICASLMSWPRIIQRPNKLSLEHADKIWEFFLK